MEISKRIYEIYRKNNFENSKKKGYKPPAFKDF